MLCYPENEGGVVDKAVGEDFEVEIKFKNIGSAEGSWRISIAFEGVRWSWTGDAQNLTLKPDLTKTLTWKDSIPSDVPVDSVARLVVYYNESYKALNWWLHVIQDAELAVSSSTVR